MLGVLPQDRHVIRFFVAGVPRAMQIKGVATFKKAGKVHMVPKRANTEWAVLVGQIGREHAPPTPWTGPVVFIATFWLPMPASMPKRLRDTAPLPVKRPDLENLIHKLTDQWLGVFYADDSQVTDILARKRYALDGRTGVEIIVAPTSNAHALAALDQVELDAEPAHR